MGKIFKTVNAITFTKGILESPYKVIKRPWNKLPYNSLYIFYGPSGFSSFGHLNCYYFGIILTKSIKEDFLELIH